MVGEENRYPYDIPIALTARVHGRETTRSALFFCSPRVYVARTHGAVLLCLTRFRARHYSRMHLTVIEIGRPGGTLIHLAAPHPQWARIDGPNPRNYTLE